MKCVYANLLGNWTDISDDTVFDNQPTLKYFEEVLLVPTNDNSKISKLFEYDYINIQHDGINYRIHPSQIQIINK